MKRLRYELIVLALLVGIAVGMAGQLNSYEFFDTLVDVRGELTRNFVEEPDRQEMLDGAIEGMIESLSDPYTTYFSAEELEQFDKHTHASFSGVGAEISVNEEGQLVIVSPLEDSPAFKAGLMAGDVVLAIDGEEIKDVTVQQAVGRITGPEGTDVTLTVRHAAGEEEDITITRQKIRIQTVKGFARDAEHHWDYLLDDTAGVGYIRVTQFSDPTAGALKNAIEEAKASGMEGLIVDLRFNPGGLLSQAVTISDLFLSEGTIVSTKGRNSPERKWEATEDGDVGEFPIVVLVNEYSASASEIVSGALKDNDRAIILGTRTFGKGSVQQVMALESGNGAIKVTIAHYYLPSGRNIHRREGADTWGVDPNEGFYVPMTHEQMEAMNEARLSGDIIRDGNGEGENDVILPDRVTPQWLREERSDPQLAAALEAMLSRLETGEFEPVGKGNATLLAHVDERASLEDRRDAFQENLNKINEKLRELDQKIAGLGSESTANGEAEEGVTVETQEDAVPEERRPDAASIPEPATIDDTSEQREPVESAK